MSVGYAIWAMCFALLCAAVWLALGHSALSALVLYLISGQCAMLTLVARAALQFYRSPASSD